MHWLTWLACSTAAPPDPAPAAPEPAKIKARPAKGGKANLPPPLVAKLQERLGEAPQEAWHADFDGNGKLDWFARTERAVALFRGEGEWTAGPTSWLGELELGEATDWPSEVSAPRAAQASFLRSEGTAPGCCSGTPKRSSSPGSSPSPSPCAQTPSWPTSASPPRSHPGASPTASIELPASE